MYYVFFEFEICIIINQFKFLNFNSKCFFIIIFVVFYAMIFFFFKTCSICLNIWCEILILIYSLAYVQHLFINYRVLSFFFIWFYIEVLFWIDNCSIFFSFQNKFHSWHRVKKKSHFSRINQNTISTEKREIHYAFWHNF